MGFYQHRPVRALLVEDSDFDAALTVDAAKGLGVRISWDRVRTGEEAVEAETRERHDLALVDVRLPGMDGFGVLVALRDLRGKELPILMLSADNERTRAMRLGADGALRKPLDARVLERWVHALEDVWSKDRRALNLPPPTAEWDGTERRTPGGPVGKLGLLLAALTAWGMP